METRLGLRIKGRSPEEATAVSKERTDAGGWESALSPPLSKLRSSPGGQQGNCIDQCEFPEARIRRFGGYWHMAEVRKRSCSLVPSCPGDNTTDQEP